LTSRPPSLPPSLDLSTTSLDLIPNSVG